MLILYKYFWYVSSSERIFLLKERDYFCEKRALLSISCKMMEITDSVLEKCWSHDDISSKNPDRIYLLKSTRDILINWLVYHTFVRFLVFYNYLVWKKIWKLNVTSQHNIYVDCLIFPALNECLKSYCKLFKAIRYFQRSHHITYH